MQSKPLTTFSSDQSDPAQSEAGELSFLNGATQFEPAKKRNSPVRVLIVEDSALYRKVLFSILQKDPGILIVGSANNGAEAVRLAARLKPDVITMDINMPVMDGYEATRQIMAKSPCPIVMISSFSDGNHTFDALKAGALTIVKKPVAGDPPEAIKAMVSKVKLMADVKVVRHWSEDKRKQSTQTAVPHPASPERFLKNGVRPRLVAIASSTGGPGALATVLRPLPADFPLPILIVQHISEGFAESFASWLDKQLNLTVRIGRESDELKPGHVYIAPDSCHMSVGSRGLITLQKKMLKETICPSANVLFHSVAKTFGPSAIGIVLTGMGDDGADGLKALHERGAHTIAQDKETCVIFGMPAVAIERGAIDQVQSLTQISATLSKLVHINR